MENGENILDAVLEDDVEMIDIEEEEGELVEQENHDSQSVSAQNGVVEEEVDNKKNRRGGAKKKRNRRRKASGTTGAAVDIDRRLKEKKPYMVYTAVACLGVSALSDLINEVEAIQACGGQKTADRRFRTGGGVLWSIIKVREPNAYKEIMIKTKEFEKQFRQPSVKQSPVQKKENSSQGEASTCASGSHQSNVSDTLFCIANARSAT